MVELGNEKKNIIERCLVDNLRERGEFMESYERALMIPILKTFATGKVENYMRISLIDAVSKIFEEIPD